MNIYIYRYIHYIYTDENLYALNFLRPQSMPTSYQKNRPQGFECNRIMFSVYDRDETMGAIYGSQVDPLEEDEFLGRASVDISYLISALVLGRWMSRDEIMCCYLYSTSQVWVGKMDFAIWCQVRFREGKSKILTATADTVVPQRIAELW